MLPILQKKRDNTNSSLIFGDGSGKEASRMASEVEGFCSSLLESFGSRPAVGVRELMT